MIWVRIFRMGTVRRLRFRGLANTVPTLGRGRVGGNVEDQLVGAAVLRRKGIRHDRVRARVAGGNPDRRLWDHGPVALAIDTNPRVEDPSAGAVGREAAGRGHGRLVAAVLIGVVAAAFGRLGDRLVG